MKKSANISQNKVKNPYKNKSKTASRSKDKKFNPL